MEDREQNQASSGGDEQRKPIAADLQSQPEALNIAPLFIVTTAATALNTVYFKRMMNSYRSDPNRSAGGIAHDYAVFVSVFDILLWAMLMSVIRLLSGIPSAYSLGFPRRGILRAASIDQLGTLLATVGAGSVPGQSQVLLNQAVLPITMLMSAVGGRRYGAGEVCGAAVVLAGALLAAGVGLTPWHLVAANVDSDDQGSSSLRWGYVAFCSAQVAVAGACLAKESLMKGGGTIRRVDSPANTVAVGVAIAWARVPLGMLLALLKSGGNISAELRDGWLCFRGYSPRPGDFGCNAAAGVTLASVALYAGQTLLCLRLTQRGNATFRSIAAVTAVPVAQYLFTSKLLMSGDGVERYHPAAIAGLLLCLGGFFIYLGGHRRTAAAATVEVLAEPLLRVEQDASGT